MVVSGLWVVYHNYSIIAKIIATIIDQALSRIIMEVYTKVQTRMVIHANYQES